MRRCMEPSRHSHALSPECVSFASKSATLWGAFRGQFAINTGRDAWARIWRVAPPKIGGLISGSTSAYRYLPASVHRFPPADELAAIMQRAGLRRVRYRRLSGGAVAVHVGTVPA